jgi:hypothetical protein
MKVRLLKAARINHQAGEIVEVSPDQFNFLLSVGAAEVWRGTETKETATPKTRTVRKK